MDPSVRADQTVGGRLAVYPGMTGLGRDPPVAGSAYKSFWSLRDASPRPALQLVASDAKNEHRLTFVGTPVTDDESSSGLRNWGPTYYIELKFPLPGCWAVSVVDGSPADAVVILVVPNRP